MLRAIREIQPGWVVGENVRGLTNWNGGLVFDEVQANLEAEDYEVLPFLFPAASVNAPHRRDRIWFIAHSRRFLGNRRQDNESGESEYHRQNDKWEEETFETGFALKKVCIHPEDRYWEQQYIYRNILYRLEESRKSELKNNEIDWLGKNDSIEKIGSIFDTPELLTQ